MSNIKKILLIVTPFIVLCALTYFVGEWINSPRVTQTDLSMLQNSSYLPMQDDLCKVSGTLCWKPTRGFFDEDTVFYVKKKSSECNLDYHVEEKNDSTLVLTISEVQCNLKGDEAKEGWLFNIVNIKKHELSELKYTYKFHDGSPDSHNIINLVK